MPSTSEAGGSAGAERGMRGCLGCIVQLHAYNGSALHACSGFAPGLAAKLPEVGRHRNDNVRGEHPSCLATH
jgi:hypothetical protein